MGMYTELVFKSEIKDDLPKVIEDVLQYLFNDGVLPSDIPVHDFFKCDRWKFIGKCCSFYHVPFAMSKYSDGYIFSRSDLKNYDREIEKFIDWVTPYLDEINGTCIGWSWYEEFDEPSLIFKK